MDFREDSFMLVVGIAVVAFIMAQSVAFLIKAFRQGKRIGLSAATMKNTMMHIAPMIVLEPIFLSASLTVMPFFRIFLIVTGSISGIFVLFIYLASI